MQLISKKDLFISTRNGNCTRLYANCPRELSQAFAVLALQQGAEQYHEVIHGKIEGGKVVPVSQAVQEEVEELVEEAAVEEAAVEEVEDDGADAQIIKIIADIVERGDPKDLTPSGKVRAAVIESWLGRKATAVERDLAWEAYITNRGN
jgi:hypothetical protein